MTASPTHLVRPTSSQNSQDRPPPSLLPAFEPLSSSPSLPRPKKRPFHASPQHGNGDKQRYPTPVLTSSTLIPTSSPPHVTNARKRPPLSRTHSAALSERAPLSTVPSIELAENGESTLMGRSSNSSHYQLSTNKLISRVHVRAVYLAPSSPNEPKKVQIECTGWNGVKVHCQSRTWDLMKGDTFTSETEGADIMLDVHDARVLITWPQTGVGKALTPTDSDRSSWEGELSPSRRQMGVSGGRGGVPPNMSPLRQQQRLHSPVSPSPVVQAMQTALGDNQPSRHTPVQVYEDEPSDGEKEKENLQTQQTQGSTQIASQSFAKATQDASASHDFSDNDEENDPIISSFGPFGANLDARLSSFHTSSSPLVTGNSPHSHSRRPPLQQLKEESISPQRPGRSSESSKRRRLTHEEYHEISTNAEFSTGVEALKTHVINQLAYSALSATPLSSLFESIPLHLRSYSTSSPATSTFPGTDKKEQEGKDEDELHKPKPTSAPHSPFKETKTSRSPAPLSHSSLEQLLNSIPCVGAVQRSGKDAAGKRLESEYYYVLERDDDERRREVVMGMGGRGLRNCRKSHKQYFWRKPK